MKKTFGIFLTTTFLILAFSNSYFAQDCNSKNITLTNGAATVTGKTGGCNKFAFVIAEGQRVKVSLTSTDSKARFELQDGADDETGSKFYSNLTNFDNALIFTDFSITVKGTASTEFTLKIKVTDE